MIGFLHMGKQKQKKRTCRWWRHYVYIVPHRLHAYLNKRWMYLDNQGDNKALRGKGLKVKPQTLALQPQHHETVTYFTYFFMRM